MPRKIFKKLNENMIVSTDSVEMMEQYIASEYPDLSRDESQKVLIQYIQQRLEEHLTQFDEKYLPYIKFRLIRTALGQRPYQISAGDVLKACVHLNFGIDAFYQDLNSWIMDHAGPGVTEAEIRGFVLKLRQWARWNADKPLEEMFREETISEPEVPKQPVQEENLWRESQTGRLVPVDYNHYFDENEWKPVADDTAKPIKSSIVIRNIAIASVSLLLLVGGSLWMASSYNYEKARVLKAALSVETADATITKTETSKSSESQKTEPVVIAANDYTTQTRAGRNEIVNRSRLTKAPPENMVKEKSLPAPAKKVAEPAPQVNKMVVVGAEEGTKTPIIREYGSKLTMSAKGFMREKRDNSPDTDAQNSTGNGPVTKSRVVTANPRVIPPGSRVYINFPSEYQNMDGVYTVESNNGLQSHQVDVFFGEEAEGDDNVSKRIDAFGFNGVDVYILK